MSQDSDGRSRLMTRRLDQSQSAELPGTEGAYAPFFSPDGQWVGFFAGGQIKKIRLDGGDPIFLGDAPAGRGASWGDGDIIIAALDTRSGLTKLLASGGSVVPVTQVGQEYDEASKRWPQVLPGTNAVLFTTSTAAAYYEEASCGVASLQDGRSRIVLEHAGHVLPLPTEWSSGLREAGNTVGRAVRRRSPGSSRFPVAACGAAIVRAIGLMGRL